MKSLHSFINESMIPNFTNNKKGIEDFCEYVFGTNKDIMTWSVNPDLTITISLLNPPTNGVNNIYMYTQDLKEIPEFIIFKDIENITLGITHNKKLKNWSPKVIGTCKGVVVEEDNKLEILDLTNCECLGGKLYIYKNKKLSTIIGGRGEDVQVFIRKNKELINLDIKDFKKCKNGSYINLNKKLDISKAKYSQEICID